MTLDIARHGADDDPVSLTVVAGRTGLSRGYLEQLAAALRNARVLRAVSGRRGGYCLARPASATTIQQILEAAIGPVCVVECIDDPGACSRSDVCECRVVYALINRRIGEVLQDHTLADLLEPDWVAAHGGVPWPEGGSAELFYGVGCPQLRGAAPRTTTQAEPVPSQGPGKGRTHGGAKNR